MIIFTMCMLPCTLHSPYAVTKCYLRAPITHACENQWRVGGKLHGLFFVFVIS